jgi:hypothetical protein
MSKLHVVQELCFELDFASEQQAFDLQDRLSHFARHRAQLELKDAFDAATPAGTVLRLDALELDLGWLDPADSEEVWATRLRQALQDALGDVAGPAALALAQAELEVDAEANATQGRPSGSGARWRSASQARMDTLGHYLLSGQWPWHAAPGIDAAALALEQWQASPQDLLTWLRAQPVQGALRQRLAWHAPAVWRELEPLLAGVTPPPERLQAVSPSRGAAVGGQRPLLRRLQTLLADDSVQWGDDEQAELLRLWTVLHAQDPAALRQLLQHWGLQARVRRRMAQVWPQALLQDVVALWLPQAETVRLEAFLRQESPGGAQHREAWVRLLRTLLAPSSGAQPVRVSADDLIRLWRNLATDAADPTDPSGPRPAVPEPPKPWPHLREQSAQLPREAFQALLQHALGSFYAPEVAAQLTALAFDEPPAAWRGADGAHRVDVPQRLQWALELIQTTHPARITPESLVRLWWRRWSARMLCSPDEWLQRLRATATAANAPAQDAARVAAWLRWLARPAEAPVASAVAQELRGLWSEAAGPDEQIDASARITLDGSADAAELHPATLRRLALAVSASALHPGRDGSATRPESRLSASVGELSAAAWQALLQAFLSASELSLLLQGLASLATQSRRTDGTGGLRVAVLATLLSGNDAAAALAAAVRALAFAQNELPAAVARRAAAHATLAGHAGVPEALLATVEVGSLARPAAQALSQQRHWAGLLRLAEALASAPAGKWDDVAADWHTLLQSEPAALRALVRQQLLNPQDRQRVLAWLPAQAWAELLALLLPAAPELARAADLLSRTAGPHVAVAGRDLVLAWILGIAAVRTGHMLQAEAVQGLLHHLAQVRGVSPGLLAAQAGALSGGAQAAALAQAARSDPDHPGLANPDGAVADGAAPSPGHLDLPHTLASDPAQARRALRLHAQRHDTRRDLLTQLKPECMPAFLALYLPDSAPDLASLVRLLVLELSGSAEVSPGLEGGGQPSRSASARPTLTATAAHQLLAEHLLCSLPQEPRPVLPAVLGELLALAADRLALAVPVLARRLERQSLAYGRSPALLAPWLVPRAPVPIASRASAPDLRTAGSDRLSAAVGHLRGSGVETASRAERLRAHWQSLVQQPDEGSRHVLQRELESPLAAERLSVLLSPEELRRALTWLRPADAQALHHVWPELQALPTPAHKGWVAVARAVLQELFQEDRDLHGPGLLQRVARAVQRLKGPAATEQPAAPPLVLPWAPPDEGEPAFIGNAGLVLLTPYLERLFTMLKLVQDKAFVDAAAAVRTTLLMQYLVTGQAAAAEPELALNKLLCGLPLATPVPPSVDLTDQERDAAAGLLQAVIAHWSALGRTSVEGLRQTFLQREGRLDRADEAWQLQVAPQAFDMLLDRLPWGYSTVKFPWMQELIHVQWR